jgi:hypothetical protein
MYSLSLPKIIKKGWEDSALKNLPNCTPQFKGKLGTIFVQQYFEKQGLATRIVSDEGDLVVTFIDEIIGELEKKGEVKTALVSYSFLKSGKVNESLWWNQIRPLQSGWEVLYLVGVYPDRIRIWEFDRDNGLKLAESTGGCEHTGQGKEKGLLAVQIENKQTKSNYDLLEKYGKLLVEIDVNDIEITTK